MHGEPEFHVESGHVFCFFRNVEMVLYKCFVLAGEWPCRLGLQCSLFDKAKYLTSLGTIPEQLDL